jgi:hypothetical protein
MTQTASNSKGAGPSTSDPARVTPDHRTDPGDEEARILIESMGKDGFDAGLVELDCAILLQTSEDRSVLISADGLLTVDLDAIPDDLAGETQEVQL